MVRLEKIAYEKIVNSKTLHRARNITSPKKTDFFSEIFIRSVPDTKLARLISPITLWLSSYEWKFMRSCLLQRGISFGDSMFNTENEFRRGIINEQINRESMHPYNHQLPMWRRQGYAKVDISMMGFEAPDYIREEVRKETYMSVYDNILKYKHFVLSNYMAELTPITYIGRGSLVILDLFIIHGLFSRSAWNRYFFNEEEYIDSRKHAADFEKKFDSYGNSNITTEAGKKKFEQHMAKVNKKYPGMFAPDGEEFDFKTFYERAEQVRSNNSPNEWTRGDISLLVEGQEEPFIVSEGEGLKGKNFVGKDLPSYMKKSEKGLMQ